jgi:hypothetical protein
MRSHKKSKARKRSRAVIARMRRTGASLTAAAREEHVDPRTVLKHFAHQLRRSEPGKPYRPTKADRLVRKMLVPTQLGPSSISVRGSKQATQLGRYMSAVGKYLRTGNSSALDEFEGQSIAGHSLITDADTLRALAEAGSLQLDEIYALPGSSS